MYAPMGRDRRGLGAGLELQVVDPDSAFEFGVGIEPDGDPEIACMGGYVSAGDEGPSATCPRVRFSVRQPSARPKHLTRSAPP